jgi:transcriptional regulator with XRE-family HTH domain
MDDQRYLELLGKRIQKLRKAKKLSQVQLAERLDTQHTQVGRIERGEVNTSIGFLRKIAKELKISVSDLLRGIE